MTISRQQDEHATVGFMTTRYKGHIYPFLPRDFRFVISCPRGGAEAYESARDGGNGRREERKRDIGE